MNVDVKKTVITTIQRSTGFIWVMAATSIAGKVIKDNIVKVLIIVFVLLLSKLACVFSSAFMVPV